MKTAKQELRDMVESLPDDVSMERAILEMQNRASIRRGFEQLDRGEGVSHAEVKERLRAWRGSFGRPKQLND